MQNIMTTLRGYQYKRERNGKYYQQFLNFYENFDYTDKERIQAYQDRELQRLLEFAVNHSPFYKKFYQDLNLGEIKTAKDLKKLPILEKEIVRNHLEEMYTVKRKEAVVSQTSGTTGKSLEYFHTVEGIQRRNAILDDFKKGHGFLNGQMKKASFNASEIISPKQKAKIFWRDNIAMKQRLYSSYHTKGENIKYYVENLNAYKPVTIDGYPSTIYEVARYINKNNIALDFQPLAIFPTAETLLPYYREEIERAFKCKVFNQYASSEGAPFVIECAEGHLHYQMLSGIIEQDEDNEMLITTFMNDGTPLIRYRIGDKIEFDHSDKKCACGSAFPIVKTLQGRTDDYIQTQHRGKVTAVFLSLLSEDFKNSIVAMQFIQERLNHVIVNIVTDENYEQEIDDIIRERLVYTLGEDMKIELRKLSEIEKDKSGKFKFVDNQLARQQ
jgi:phenylacetate-CoA ligase